MAYVTNSEVDYTVQSVRRINHVHLLFVSVNISWLVIIQETCPVNEAVS